MGIAGVIEHQGALVGSEWQAHRQAVDAAEHRRQSSVNHMVGFKVLATIGTLLAAAAPALMATADGTTLRDSVSAYWNVEPRIYFWLPFTASAAFLLADGLISYLSNNKDDYGRRWYNIVLGVALLVLTWFDKDNDSSLHNPAAAIFFGLFIVVVAYTSALAWVGRHVEGHAKHDKEIERVSGQTSLVFLVFIAIMLAGYTLNWISFFFFEIFALLAFAFYYVQGLFRAFPYRHYEFPWARANLFFRKLHVMESLPQSQKS